MTVTVAQVVAQVLDFVDSPDLDTLRPVNRDSYLYLGWDETYRPRLCASVAVSADLVRQVVAELAVVLGGDTVQVLGNDLAVWLDGDQYTALPAERLLRIAEEYHDSDVTPRVRQTLTLYAEAGGDVRAARCLALTELSRRPVSP